jgi:hypothetical protein
MATAGYKIVPHASSTPLNDVRKFKWIIFLYSFFVCLFVYSHTSNFSAIWLLSPLPVTGLQI